MRLRIGTLPCNACLTTQYCLLSEQAALIQSKWPALCHAVAEDMHSDEEAVAGTGGGEAADMMLEDEEADAGPSSGGEKVADRLQEEEEGAARSDPSRDGDASAGPGCIDGAKRSPQTGTLFTRQKALLSVMLQRMFKNNTGGRLELAQLVGQFNKLAMKPASAEEINQACAAGSSCHPNLEHPLYFQVDCVLAMCTYLLPSHHISQNLKGLCLKMLERLICTH